MLRPRKRSLALRAADPGVWRAGVHPVRGNQWSAGSARSMGPFRGTIGARTLRPAPRRGQWQANFTARAIDAAVEEVNVSSGSLIRSEQAWGLRSGGRLCGAGGLADLCRVNRSAAQPRERAIGRLRAG